MSYTDIILNMWFEGDYTKWRNWWFLGDTKRNSAEESRNRIRQSIGNLSPTDFQNLQKDNDDDTCMNLLAKIIYYDQWMRQLNIKNLGNSVRALELSYNLIRSGKIYDFNNDIQIAFSLLPFRHTNEDEHILYSIHHMEKYPGPIANRFIRASLLRLRKTKQNFNYNIDSINKIRWFHYYNEFKRVLDETFQYETDYTEMNFNCLQLPKSFTEFSNFIESKRGLMNGSEVFFISLSGGVDSMVALVMCFYYKKYVNPQFIYSAIHINWNQREESTQEAMFLCKYCANNNIKLEYRNVDWLSRKDNRTQFENEARTFRFSTYRECFENIKKKLPNISGCYVFMGHHAGDIEENVFMNIVKGNNYMDLGKMKIEEMIDGVPIVRPFLRCNKSDIYSFASIMGVPFFKDTTPDWSMRGHIRRRIFPTMENTIGKQFHRGFANIAKKSNEMKQLITTALIEPYMKEVNSIQISGTNGKKYYIMPFKNELPPLFYDLVFTRIHHSWGLKKPKRTVIEQWMQRIISNTKWNTISLTKNSEICRANYSDENNIIYFVLRPII
jgi:tRNA(Ile)-lysidine synthetase-like protein